MIKKMIVGCFVILNGHALWAQPSEGSRLAEPSVHRPPPSQPRPTGSYYDWARATDGTGYCFQFNEFGQVLNGGYPVPDINCERVRPSFYDWARASNGYGYCFQFTPDFVVMRQGRPAPQQQCERIRPSYFRWGQATDGWTYCFQFTPNGYAMNDGHPVPNFYCGGRIPERN